MSTHSSPCASRAAPSRATRSVVAALTNSEAQRRAAARPVQRARAATACGATRVSRPGSTGQPRSSSSSSRPQAAAAFWPREAERLASAPFTPSLPAHTPRRSRSPARAHHATGASSAPRPLSVRHLSPSLPASGRRRSRGGRARAHPRAPSRRNAATVPPRIVDPRGSDGPRPLAHPPHPLRARPPSAHLPPRRTRAATRPR